MEIKEKVSSIRNEDTTLMINSRSSEAFELLEEAGEMHDNTVADEACHSIVKNTAGKQVEGILLSSNDNSVA